MLQEAQKFLDLDMVGQTILDEGDRSLFQEAVQCYQIGSHRAAVILTWCATADCLRRRLNDLANEGDAPAQQAQTALEDVKGQACYEENLIALARRCELIDDIDERALRFARDTRSQCAHPTGVIPSAEAVRHIFHICIQSVLSQRGYRGMTFIRDVVTVQFDDRHFLPNDSKAEDHCLAILEKVPKRSWPQFACIAAKERPGPLSEIWKQRALVFFRVMLSAADGLTAQHIAAGFQGFEAKEPDFFATLVGIDPRVTNFWDAQKRAQARARLIAASAARITAEQVHSWAVICSADGLEDGDKEMLRQRLGSISRHLIAEEDFLHKKRDDLLNLVQDMLLNEVTSGQAVVAINNLLRTRLFDEKSDAMQVIVETIVERFARDTHYRQLIEQVRAWTGRMLVTLLEMSELFLSQCSDDNPEDVLFVIDAARALARLSPVEVPETFSKVVNRVLRKELFPEWADSESAVGSAFLRQLALLLQQEQTSFPDIDHILVTTALADLDGKEEMVDEPDEVDRDASEEGQLGGADENPPQM